MTIDDRIERLEHVTAAWIEQSRKDYEENRLLWREHQTAIAAIWNSLERGFEETKQRFRETDERFRETDERFRESGERVDKLVLAIAELVRRMDS